MQTSDVLFQTGVSPRQLDHWTTKGLIPGLAGQKANPGTGVRRDWSASQVEFIQLMGDLVRAGVKPAEASDIVTDLLAGKSVTVGGSITISRNAS